METPGPAFDEARIVCVDFNGVLDLYTGWQGDKHFDAPRRGAREFLRALVDRELRVVIFTTRYPDDVWRWLREHQLDSLVSDVTDPSQPAWLVGQAVERFGGLHIVVPNAGGPPSARALEVTDEQIEAAVNANMLTSVRLVREAVPYMRAAQWGRICLIASWTIKQPSPTLALSNTARTGLWAWAKTAAGEVSGDGITVNTACPGSHATDRNRVVRRRSTRPP